MHAPLVIAEGDRAYSVFLNRAEYRALSAVGIVTVAPTLEADHYDLIGGRKVGAISFGTRQLIVRPKITDLNRLLFLLGYASSPSVWRDDPVQLESADELLPAVAEAFSRLANRALEQGLLQGYRTVQEDLSVLRGRLLASEQLGRLYAMPVPVAVEYDDFSADIPENQLLAMASARLLRVPRISDTARRTLLRLRRTLIDISIPARGSTPPRWQSNRLNARYAPALRLAEIILAADSFDHMVGDVAVTGYMFDMWRIFEDFVSTALSEALIDLGWHAKSQARLHLDHQHRIDMRPDLVCCRHDVPLAVVDAKYKAERPEGFPNADLYQMLAYCAVLGFSEGHLVYAKGNESIATHCVQRADITIYCHAVDLSATPDKLLVQIDDLARIVTKSANPNGNAQPQNEWRTRVGWCNKVPPRHRRLGD